MTKQAPLRLHGHPMSSNARRVMLTLAHLGLPYELVPVNLRSAEERAGLRAINPNGKIPVLEHGDFWLWESHAIMQYVAELVPGQALYPYAPRDRADVNRWLFWHNAHLAPGLGTLGFERVWKKHVTGGDPEPALVASAAGQVTTALQIADAHLAGREWLAAGQMTLADLSLAATLANAPMYGVDLTASPHLVAHGARIARLPAWAATAPTPFPATAPTTATGPRANVG